MTFCRTEATSKVAVFRATDISALFCLIMTKKTNQKPLSESGGYGSGRGADIVVTGIVELDELGRMTLDRLRWIESDLGTHACFLWTGVRWQIWWEKST
jgi:hypothetical protein